jgi:hypothetical protein
MRRGPPSFTHAAAGCLVGLALVLMTRAAGADPPLAQATLSYERQKGAEECPDESALREQVARKLGYDPFRAEAAQHVSIVLAGGPKGLHARITMADSSAASPAATASRQLDSGPGGCDELVQSVVLAVSLAIDPLSFAHPRAPASEGAPPAPNPPAAPEAEPKAETKAATPDAPAPWNVGLSLAGRVGAGLVPAVSAGPVIEAYLARKHWALVAQAGADLSTSSDTPAGGTAGVKGSLLRAGVGVCGVVSWVLLCARVDAGALEGSGTTAETSGATIYSDIALAPRLDLPLRRDFHLNVGGDLLAPLTPTKLRVTSTSSWTTPAIAGTLQLGLGYWF